MAEHDFIVVGAGSTGCVVASRLAEDPNARVLLLGAGPGEIPPAIDDPINFASMFGSAVDWNYETVPQPGLGGRTVRQPRGKLLGGTSNLYGMMHQRCPAADYDAWAYNGAIGWRYADVLPYLERLEANGLGEDRGTSHTGPLPLASAEHRSHSPISDAFLAACAERGHAANADLNGAVVEGAGWAAFNIQGGRRCSSRAAYLEPAMARCPNLVVETEAYATRLVLEGAEGVRRCVGVEYIRAGTRHAARAGAEVVVRAGSIETPKLLLLSGIGEPEGLRAHGLEPLLPLTGVGQNLRDHSMVWVNGRLKRPLPRPPFTNFETGLFLRSDPGWQCSDLEVVCMASSFADIAAGRDPGSVDLVAALVRPVARGWVRLASADPRDPPLVHPNYLGAAVNLERQVAIIDVARDLLMTEALSRWIEEEDAPGPAVRSRRDMAAFAQANALPQWHVAGSCRMGLDEGAVVDPALRVRGTERLRVVDTSVMPSIPSGHCHAAVLMIAERAADMISEANGMHRPGGGSR